MSMFFFGVYVTLLLVALAVLAGALKFPSRAPEPDVEPEPEAAGEVGRLVVVVFPQPHTADLLSTARGRWRFPRQGKGR